MKRKIPSTSALVCFEAAARHESFTKAADELALTQSAVCRQIASLESYLGVPLFRRTRRGVVLTEAGATYSRRIGQRLDAVERDTLALMAHPGLAGTLDLAVVPTFATRWLVPRLPGLAKQQPDLVLNLETRTRPFLFADSDFDAALYAGTPEQVGNWPGTEAVALLREDLVPVCSPALIAPGRALAPAEVAAFPLLQQSTRPYGWRRWFAAQGVQHPRDSAGPRYELFSMLAAAASHGLGMALMPPLLIESELARGELVVACDRPQRGERFYYFVTPERKAGDPLVTRLRDWIVAEAAASAAAAGSA
ncbi:LysR family transcriptional regulator [Aquabacterium sp. A7-Y]|uniref:LysR family transcriptional regulator n=1 Tax=Aquabacterium sp. A7-Y TaxID=1349605 RepID=UPI00223DD503|nr:LysR family transcriptional regulator [Aquabacterium sp. A7-Y]MCW7541049.1 LysR family transcriptional regulator [Aquabacterium sp. A7-Y]